MFNLKNKAAATLAAILTVTPPPQANLEAAVQSNQPPAANHHKSAPAQKKFDYLRTYQEVYNLAKNKNPENLSRLREIAEQLAVLYNFSFRMDKLSQGAQRDFDMNALGNKIRISYKSDIGPSTYRHNVEIFDAHSGIDYIKRPDLLTLSMPLSSIPGKRLF